MSGPDAPVKPRSLVLCFDGTTNQYDATNTNVVQFYSLLAKDQPLEQITYYQAGVGTYFNPGVVSPLFDWAAKLLDEAIAWYLDAHVRDGYRFLMQNYRAGDKICLFGFSRGAYTARALAGLIYKIGLLPRDNDEQIPFAYKLYKNTDKQKQQLCAGFKQSFCRSVVVDFVGVWDTVASVGVVYGRDLPFTNSNAGIRTFRQALALDERRAKFQPNLYHRAAPDKNSATPGPEHTAPVATQPPNGITDLTDSLDCDVLEVWFAGCHSDVGGGAVADNVTHSLADIPLHWMIRQVVLSEVGILFDADALGRENLDISAILKAGDGQTYGTVLASTSPGETTVDESANTEGGGPSGSELRERQQLDADALTPLHDELKLNIVWWILEMMPMEYSWQDLLGKWHRKWGFNFGRGRVIHEDHPYFHITVKERIKDAALKYYPNARWTKGQEVYVR